MTPEALAALHAASFRGERSWTEREFARLLADAAVFLVTTDDGASGFALGRVAAGEAEILTLAVAPEAREQGHGRALLRAFESAALARGALDAFLEVSNENAPALALYISGGYGERGRRPGYYSSAVGGRADALLLGRPLG